MTKQWVDFKELKEQLDARQVLARFDISLRGSGSQLHGFCPLPNHKHHEGKPRSPSFSVNVDLKAFHCFGCGASGNLLEFACLMKGGDPDDPVALREAALDLGQAHVAAGDRGAAKPLTREPRKSTVLV
jgi:DNA primase